MLKEEDLKDKKDEDLISLALENPDFYGYLIERYTEKLTRYIQRISSVSKEDAEDILQEVFISAYKNLNEFDRDLKFSSWIYRITHNKVISHWRKSKKNIKIDLAEDDSDIFKLIPSEENIEEDFLRKCTAVDMRKIISEMDERYKEVLVLKFFEEKSYEEISDILKKPTGTIGTLINRAKKQFKDIAAEKEIEFGNYSEAIKGNQ